MSEPLAAVRLVEGTRLCGEYRGSGRIDPPWLIQRGDGSVVEVSRLLYLLAGSVDGTRQAPDIAEVMTAALGRRMSASDVSYLLDHKLRPLDLVVDSNAATPSRSDTPVLGLTFRAAVLPERVVLKATSWLRPLFRPAVVGVVLALLAGVDAWLVLGPVRGSGLDELLHRPALMLMALGLTVLAGAFHELGHATACRYAGARPGVIGAGVYLVWPVFYNDLTDCYRLSRLERLRADLGGVYFNAVFILMVAAIYGLTGFEPLLVVVGLHHLLIVQQFLPFVRLDGYYIVSDLAGVPDLFRYVRPVLASLVPGRPAASSVQSLRPGPRVLVTAWVLVSVPLLLGCLGLLVLRLPDLISNAGGAIGLQYRAVIAGIRVGSAWTAMVSGLQLMLVALPVAGLLLTFLHAVLCLGRRLRRSSGATGPTGL